MSTVLHLGLFALALLPLFAVPWCQRRERLLRNGLWPRTKPATSFLALLAIATSASLLSMLCSVLLQQHQELARHTIVAQVLAAGFSLSCSYYCALRLYLYESLRTKQREPSKALVRKNTRAWFLFVGGFVLVTGAVSGVLLWIPGFPSRAGFRLVIGAASSAIVLCFYAPRFLRRVVSSHPLPRGPLLRGVRALSLRAGLRAPRVRVIEKGELEMLPNALVTGLTSGSCTIFLTEPLVDGFECDEVLAVVAHELGHARLGHLARNLLANVVSILTAWAAGAALPWIPEFGRPVVQSFLYLVFCTLGTRLLMRRAEFAADRFGAEILGDARPLIGALEKLENARRRLDEGSGSSHLRRLGALLQTHPPTRNRIAALVDLSRTKAPDRSAQ